MNLIIHTDHGGQLTAEIAPGRIVVTASDDGPGIADIEQALVPGYSTAPNWIREMGFGAGMGLANIKTCADAMTLESTPKVGTRLEMVFQFQSADAAAAPTDGTARQTPTSGGAQ
jgi:anti-sigma regulatory factor (Ser/Thr protein kinase)